jgi:putative ABC transport system permease protein
MLRLSVRRVTSDKRRALGTGVAVVLGVAFLAATLVLSDTMRAGFRTLFADFHAGTDLAVRSEDGIGDPSDEGFIRHTVDASLVETVGAVPGVARATAEIEGVAQVIGAGGAPIGGEGPPTVGRAWVDDPQLNPFHLREGRAPVDGREVVVDAATAEQGGLAVGDLVEVRMPDVTEFELVGILAFGDRDSLAGATYAAFDPATAQHWFTGEDRISAVLVRGDDGVDPEALRERVAAAVGAGSEVLTGAELAAEQEAAIEGDFLGMVRMLLLAFAGVALVVAAFSIANTFSILVSQRSRESSLLRSLGASRSQVLWSVAAEAVLVGLVASAVGTVLGIGLADGLRRLMAATDLDLGMDVLTVRSSALLVAVTVGLVLTVASSVLPAVRASRAAPLAALRATAVEATAVGRARILMGAGSFLGGAALVAWSGRVAAAAAAAGEGAGSATGILGLGAVGVLVGAVLLAPLAAMPIGHALGRATRVLWPSARISGRLAGRNVVRNPRRTASSAVALVVGVTVVTMFATLALSMKTAMDAIVNRTFGGDIVVSSEWGSAGIGPSIVADVVALPEVDRWATLTYGMANVAGNDRDVVVTDVAALEALTDLGVDEGSLAEIGPGQVAVSRELADDLALSVGDLVPTGFADGATTELTVGAIYRETDFMGNVLLHPDDYLPHVPQSAVEVVLVSLVDGVDLEAAKQAVEAVSGRGGPDVQTRAEFVDSIAAELDQALALVYGLLALAVLIALMGIANTLALSIHERTREIGLLRAVGQSRRQLRSTVRWESVVTAALGATGGLLVGTFLGWGVLRVAFARSEGIDAAFTIPTGSIVAIVVLAMVAGVLAAVRPARRAARLDVLDALAAV